MTAHPRARASVTAPLDPPWRDWFQAVLIGWLFIAIAGTTGMPAEYAVGPGQPLQEVGDVPWEALEPGDVVRIHARREPYRAKWVICRRGTAERPIVVSGVPAADGTLPVIDGRDAVTRPQLNFWSEERGVIKVGGANRPADTMPAHIVIENLDIRGARPPYEFSGRSGSKAYLKNASCIFLEKGEDITIRGCILHDSGNGLFSSSGSKRVLIEGCWLHDNGIEGSILEHNNYTSSQGITYQFNRFGPLRAGCLGNNLKDRSAGLVVRYNWIEGGNRALDLVDGTWGSDLDPGINYHETFVYGNILIKLDEKGNNQVVHYGGDSGKLEQYRKGMLYFYHNTVVSHRPETTMLFRLSSMEERADCRNNIVFTTAPGRHLAIFGGSGTVDLHENWLKAGWRETHTQGDGRVLQHGRILTGETPGFLDLVGQDYRLATDAVGRGAAGALPDRARPDHLPRFEYTPHRRGIPLSNDVLADLGAFQSGSR